MDSRSGFYSLIDGLLALRVAYGFLKTYFQARQGPSPPTKPIRVYMDGCFDMMHFGHANALRQARNLGDVLIVGICPDSEIAANKGPPVMNDRERISAVRSVKWVDEVVTDVPYNVTADFLDYLIREYKIDFVVHGDDPCLDKDGNDVYAEVKRRGKFREIKRTEGVSSTDIVGRMLLCTKNHHQVSEPNESDGAASRSSVFLPTTRRLVQFASGSRAPKPTDRVVYVDGAFDMFHYGHIETLRKAKELGDFLLVGIHDDVTVNQYKGRNFPIMNLHERTLSVLSCRSVDEVIIGAPWSVTEDLIKTMNISVVVHGSHWERGESDHETGRDPYAVAKQNGIYAEVDSESDLSVSMVIERIVQNRDQYVRRNTRKVAQEARYLEKKSYVEEL